MKNLLKKALVPALIALAIVQTGALVKNLLDDRRLDQSKYENLSQTNPVCLSEPDGLAVYILIESDEVAKVYRGLRVVMFMVLPMEVSMRNINVRSDLIEVNCLSGQPLGN